MRWSVGRLEGDGKTAFPIRDFASLPYIGLYPGMDTDNRRILKRAGVAPKVRMSTYDSYAAWTMVEAGLGVAMNSRRNSAFQEGSVRVLPLVQKTVVSIGMAWKTDLTPAAREFLSFCEARLSGVQISDRTGRAGREYTDPGLQSKGKDGLST